MVVLTGARQTGKTSTFRRLFPQYGFVTLDLPTEAEQAEKEPQSFPGRHPEASEQALLLPCIQPQFGAKLAL